MPKISLIMPCYNRAHDLIRTLRAYDNQDFAGRFEVVAVDDASNDSTYEVLSSYRPAKFHLRVERMEHNSGQGAARNRVIPTVTSPLTMFVGDDMIPQPDFIRGHLAAHRRQPAEEVAILGRTEWSPKIPRNTLMTHIDGIGAQQFSYYYLQNEQKYDFRHFYTSNISLKTSFLKSVDRWFDEDFNLYGYEDTELGYRLEECGMQIIYQSALLLHHNHYYNIWTFSNRQRKSGLMANVLLAKHPRLRTSPKFRFHYMRVLNLFRRSDIIRKPHPRLVRQLEEVALRLASTYEWKPIATLDRLYLAMLDYFYYDGFIAGLFKNPSLIEGLHTAHAARYLAPSLLWFLGASEQEDTAPPFDNLSGLVAQVSNLAS